MSGRFGFGALVGVIVVGFLTISPASALPARVVLAEDFSATW